MKINKIKLYNFSSYEGENIIDFSIKDNEKNIILIGGKNGAGKTSLFTAIKVALYGPLAYGYVGANSYYISRIKGLINSKAFQQDKVEAGVQITVSLKMQGEIKEYVITRNWYYLKQKLYENYYVENEKGKLLEQELSYFQNYLQSIVPPDLFEFFLFDGEEVGKIFATNSYNTYVKNAVFTLCGMDVFEILRKYTNRFLSILNETYNSEQSELILLCGSVGDGKSHMLSYCKSMYPDKMDKFYVHNDSTASLYVDKPASYTLKQVLEDFSDDRIEKSNGKVILAINLGTLSNFLEADENNKFGKLKSYVENSGILNEKIDDKGENHFHCVNFADYHLYELTSKGVVSSYIQGILNKITDKNEINPFYNDFCQTWVLKSSIG